MADASTTAYDATPYPDLSYAHTHPDRLGMIATLLGLEPAPVEHCRVLELGCAVGGNLLPMAYALPGSTFVGVDYSTPQIEEARARAASLELANVEFLDADVAALPTDLGEFDYIVAHGLYSWVPAPVRDALLEVCHRHLAPNGVAFVSYNTYPGWHALQSMRELMRYRTRSIEDPRERAAEARAAVGALAEALRQDDSAYAAFVQGYAENVLPKMRDEPESADALLLHDELEEVNDPVYFHEFVEHAGRFGLRYLCEAQLANVMPERLPPGAAEHVQRLARDPIEFEQYMDFAKNRSFRETLICHANAEVGRSIDAGAVQRMFVSSRARPSKEPAADGVAAFEGLDGAVFRTNHPLTQAAFAELHRRSPAAVPFAELTEGGREVGQPRSRRRPRGARRRARREPAARARLQRQPDRAAHPPAALLDRAGRAPAREPRRAAAGRVRLARHEPAPRARHARHPGARAAASARRHARPCRATAGDAHSASQRRGSRPHDRGLADVPRARRAAPRAGLGVVTNSSRAPALTAAQ